MLNWIADLGRHVPLRRRRAAPEQREQGAPDLERHRRQGASCRSSGATRTCRGSTSASSSRSARSSSSGSILNRTTLGYEVRAVGYNPDAAAYGGISVKKNLHPRDGDLGRVRRPRRRARHARLPLPLRRLRHPGLAGRLPRDRGRPARPQHRGRRRPRARSSSAALLFGTTHGLQSSAIDPELAGNLTYMIQGLIVLFVGADLLILVRLERAQALPAEAQRREGRGGGRMTAGTGLADTRWVGSTPRGRSASVGLLLGVVACLLTIPPIRRARSSGRSSSGSLAIALRDLGASRAASAGSGGARSRRASLGIGLGFLAIQSSTENLNIVFRPDLIASMFVFSTPLVFAGIGGMFSRAQRRREHRPRGDDADGRLLRRLRRGQGRQLGASGSSPRCSPAACWRSCTPSSRSICAPTRSSAATAVNFLALGITGYFFFQLYHGAGRPGRHLDDPERARSRSSRTGASSARRSAT